MRVRPLARALIRFCFLISLLAIVTGVASAQENQNSTQFAASTISDISRTHISVGDINRSNNGINSDIVLFVGSFNWQGPDLNQTHISVGDINHANYGMNSDTILFVGSFNWQGQDLNRTHISVGDLK